jgi:glycosyltransferase involved in cell wall biosynthesis
MTLEQARGMTPLVSVVIPTFNRAGLVVNAIESVFAQTFKDYEVVVVDDGSTDNTREALEPYGRRIRYFYQTNRGASAAQNKGIELATGEWISILADDDEWLPTKLERQLEVLGQFGSDFGACFTNCEYTANSAIRQTTFEMVGLRTQPVFGALDDPVRYILARDVVIWVQSVLVRKSLVAEVGAFDEAMVVAEDTDLLIRLALRTRFCFVAEPLVRIDRNPARERLIDLFALNSEKMFSSLEHMYRKWLALPEMDLDLRARTLENLGNLYLAWTIRNLYHCRIAGALAKVKKGSEFGGGYLHMLSRLAYRALRKICRPLRSNDALDGSVSTR